MYTPIKELGQNFLLDSDSCIQMVDSLELGAGDLVVEIGPGLGALTKNLVKKMQDVDARGYAVEVDERFVNVLKDAHTKSGHLQVVHDDILSWLLTFKPSRSFKVIGSLPYYITSPILHSLIKHPMQPSLCVLLMQKEVALKITSGAPDASYMSTFVQTFYDAEIVKIIPRAHFDPVPQVDGAVLKLTKKNGVSMSVEEIVKYEGFLHKGFATPRKMLNKVFKKEVLLELDIDPTARPQQLSLDQWSRLVVKLL
ncbi:ribosomal RNA small subunit methyltransferase A [Patescibacteria group bacterium]|nr:ribosomal RNA small subunit methyltransferase A [Patescibacteria group bacterium]